MEMGGLKRGVCSGSPGPGAIAALPACPNARTHARTQKAPSTGTGSASHHLARLPQGLLLLTRAQAAPRPPHSPSSQFQVLASAALLLWKLGEKKWKPLSAWHRRPLLPQLARAMGASSCKAQGPGLCPLWPSLPRTRSEGRRWPWPHLHAPQPAPLQKSPA